MMSGWALSDPEAGKAYIFAREFGVVELPGILYKKGLKNSRIRKKRIICM